ncbi:MAG: hypothetical protein IK015_10870 [Treponema sp.]|nr:hypothetical protein [Treponema sp.]
MSEHKCFGDTDYIFRVFDGTKKSDKNLPIEKALKTAHDIRKFEIDLFWRRGTYYWAFILAAFTAHFALIGLLFSEESNKEFCFEEFCNLSGMALLALAVTALFCFIFSFSWVLVNKGSKFWQENWEEHIYNMEDGVLGRLYKTYLNTSFKSEFDPCPMSCAPYAYSVTKVTMMTSITLCIFTFALTMFYIGLLFFKLRDVYIPFAKWFVFAIVPCSLVLLLFLILLSFSKHGKSKNFEKSKDAGIKWFQRPQ